MACFSPKVSVSVDGKREKISPQPKKTTPENSTNNKVTSRVSNHRVIAMASSPKASNRVVSRPIRSDTQPKNGRVNPLVIRSNVKASGNAPIPKMVASAMPKSLEKDAICEMTMRPDVDIIDIIKNINQKTGVFNIPPELSPSVFLLWAM